MKIAKITRNEQSFFVFGTKLSNDNFNATRVLDSTGKDITNVVEAFGLWHEIETLTLEKILKDEKVQK